MSIGSRDLATRLKPLVDPEAVTRRRRLVFTRPESRALQRIIQTQIEPTNELQDLRRRSSSCSPPKPERQPPTGRRSARVDAASPCPDSHTSPPLAVLGSREKGRDWRQTWRGADRSSARASRGADLARGNRLHVPTAGVRDRNLRGRRPRGAPRRPGRRASGSRRGRQRAVEPAAARSPRDDRAGRSRRLRAHRADARAARRRRRPAPARVRDLRRPATASTCSRSPASSRSRSSSLCTRCSPSPRRIRRTS